jgi:ribosomal protein L37AE/L43A
MEQKLDTFVPPKSCPICSVAMQATKRDERIIHKCERCGMIITIVLQAKSDK